jgi:integrase
MSKPDSIKPADSANPAKPSKPAKPYSDFPLYAHAVGQWAKKIRGRVVYFGHWSDPDGALRKYNENKQELHSGRKVRPNSEGATVKEICNAYLVFKAARRDEGIISPRTWAEYKATCDTLVATFGKHRPVDDLDPDDFGKLRGKLAKRFGPVRLGNELQRVRSVFKHALEAGLIDRPVRFGPAFVRPSKKVLRLNRAKRGPQMFSPFEMGALIDGALVVGSEGPELVIPGIHLRAMFVLAINCGLGNTDIGRLPLSALDLDNGWLDFPRPKTGIARRCPLWRETVAAIRESLAKRPQPKDPADAGLVFITKAGHGWAKEAGVIRLSDGKPKPPDNPVSKETRKLLDLLGINGQRGFYAIRHTHRTVSDAARDQPASNAIMGHAADDMASQYREHIDDSRLRAVAEHVRQWLYA